MNNHARHLGVLSSLNDAHRALCGNGRQPGSYSDMEMRLLDQIDDAIETSLELLNRSRNVNP